MLVSVNRHSQRSQHKPYEACCLVLGFGPDRPGNIGTSYKAAQKGALWHTAPAVSSTVAQLLRHPTLLPPEHECGQPPGTDVLVEITVRNRVGAIAGRISQKKILSFRV